MKEALARYSRDARFAGGLPWAVKLGMASGWSHAGPTTAFPSPRGRGAYEAVPGKPGVPVDPLPQASYLGSSTTSPCHKGAGLNANTPDVT